MLLIGLGANYLKERGNSFEIVRFDYSEQDSLFTFSSHETGKMIEKSVDSERELLDFRVDKIESGSKNEPDLAELRVYLNSADVNVLVQLPGIGEKTAQRIIDYRNSVAKFRSIEDLMLVKGIGIKKFEKISKYIFVE